MNSDADLLATFLGFLRRFFGVGDALIAFSVNCFLNNGLTLAEIEGWWRERLRIPLTCMRAATVNRPSSASRRRRYRVLIHGTGRLVVHSTFIVQSIYGGIQELAGIERPEWLDL